LKWTELYRRLLSARYSVLYLKKPLAAARVCGAERGAARSAGLQATDARAGENLPP